MANSETFISVYDLAYFIKDNFASHIDVRLEVPQENMGYAPVSRLDLDTEKINHIGWSPKVDLYSMLQRLISYYRNI